MINCTMVKGNANGGGGGGGALLMELEERREALTGGDVGGKCDSWLEKDDLDGDGETTPADPGGIPALFGKGEIGFQGLMGVGVGWVCNSCSVPVLCGPPAPGSKKEKKLCDNECL